MTDSRLGQATVNLAKALQVDVKILSVGGHALVLIKPEDTRPVSEAFKKAEIPHMALDLTAHPHMDYCVGMWLFACEYNQFIIDLLEQ